MTPDLTGEKNKKEIDLSGKSPEELGQMLAQLKADLESPTDQGNAFLRKETEEQMAQVQAELARRDSEKAPEVAEEPRRDVVLRMMEFHRKRARTRSDQMRNLDDSFRGLNLDQKKSVEEKYGQDRDALNKLVNEDLDAYAELSRELSRIDKSEE